MASSLAAYGSVDVRACGARAAIVAANSRYTVDRILKQFKNSRDYRILKQFKNSRDYRVTPYSALRHTKAGQMALWSSAILTTSLVLYLLHRNVNK